MEQGLARFRACQRRVVLARTQFVEENEAAFEEFLEDYAASVEFVNANTQDAAALVAQYGIVPKAEVAEKGPAGLQYHIHHRL